MRNDGRYCSFPAGLDEISFSVAWFVGFERLDKRRDAGRVRFLQRRPGSGTL
jgi:hypothetical protein